MSNHSIGTFVALLILGCLLNIVFISLTPGVSQAQLSELSEIQNGIFHLSHNPGMNAETFANDQYIDEDQADFFAAVARPRPYTPADENYPFSLVDHYILDSDLEIVYHYDSTICPAYPRTAYLSRHNISYADYTNRKSPPETFFTVIKGTDPYTGEKATAVYMEVTGYEVTVPEMKHKSATPGEDCYTGWVYNTHVRVDHAQVSVWTRSGDTDLMKRCAPETRYFSCLPPSANRQPKTIRILKIPFDPSCPANELPLLEPPRSSCYYPLPPERDSAAAVNWSYNYRKGNLSPGTVTAADRKNDSGASVPVNPCRTCR